MKLALCLLTLVALAHARVERVYPRKSLARGSTSGREVHQQEHKEHEAKVDTHDNEPKEVLSHHVEPEKKTEAYHPRGSLSSRGHVRGSQHQEQNNGENVKIESEKNGHSRMEAIREALAKDDEEHVRRTRSHHGYGNYGHHRHSSESSSSSSSSESHEHGNHGHGRQYQHGYGYQQGYGGHQQGYGGYQQGGGYGGRQGYGR